MKYKKWTNEEISFLLKNYKTMYISDIADILGRTVKTTVNKLYDFNIKGFKIYKYSNNKWTDEDLILLKKVYPYYTNEYIASVIFNKKYNKDNIKYMGRNKMKLRKANKYELGPTKREFTKEYMLKSLLDLYKKLGRTPTIFDLKNNNMPSSKSYERYFGSYTNACKCAGLKINFKSIHNKDNVFYAKDGTECFSNSEVIITSYLIDNNIDFIKDEKYITYTNIKEFGNKRFDWKVRNYFIEFFGLIGYKDYDIDMNKKIELCNKNNIKLICLFKEDLTNLNRKMSFLNFQP